MHLRYISYIAYCLNLQRVSNICHKVADDNGLVSGGSISKSISILRTWRTGYIVLTWTSVCRCFIFNVPPQHDRNVTFVSGILCRDIKRWYYWSWNKDATICITKWYRLTHLRPLLLLAGVETLASHYSAEQLTGNWKNCNIGTKYGQIEKYV